MRIVHRVLSITLGLLLLATGLICLGVGYEMWHQNHIYPGVQVWDVHIGGMPPEEAAALLTDQMMADQQGSLTLRGPDRVWEVRPIDLGLTLVANATAQEAFELGRESADGLKSHLQLLLNGAHLAPIFSFDESVARLYLEALADQQIDHAPVDAAISWDGNIPVASAAQTGRALDVEATLAALRAALGNPSSNVIDLVVVELPPRVTDAESARAHLEGLLSETFTLVLPNPREGDPGPWFYPPDALADLVRIDVVDDHLEATLDDAQARAYVEAMSPELAIEPVDARFDFNEASSELVAIAPSVDGRALDVEATLANFAAAVNAGQHAARVIVQAVPPSYPDTATAEELGIRELVIEADSYFIGSPSGRDNNIRVAAARFNGIVIDPGETFSFNHYLGEVSVEEGYDEAYITAGEELAIEVGGGICQVSTTAFRAALWGGYPIVERWYHNHRVGYYELRGYGPGFDATVYSPLVDFKFTNDRTTPLLVETEIQESAHQLIFRFYSTDDGRQVEVEGPEIMAETEPGPPIYQLDETVEPGTMIEWQSAANGLDVNVERWVYAADGNLLYYGEFVSRYAARRASYHYGPGYEPPTSESE
jgi:vancomycin resistance protein YoaR